MTSLYDNLQSQIDALGYGNALGRRLDNILDEARANADETVYVEKTTSEWHTVLIASLESLLCYCDDKELSAWFASRGVTF